MDTSVPVSPRRDSRSFQNIADAFLSGEGLSFAEVLSAERIERIFRKHGCVFGLHGVYTTAIMVLDFLSQVLRDGKDASCRAAVTRYLWSDRSDNELLADAKHVVELEPDTGHPSLASKSLRTVPRD